MIPLLFGISILAYGLINLAPGDPVSSLINPDVGGVSADDLLARKRELGLDAPLPVRYLRWLGELLHGNLGYSIATGVPVTTRLAERLGATLQLMAAALLISTVIGVLLGVVLATRPDSPADTAGAVGSFIASSVPTFFIGLGAIYLFSLKFDLLPTGGMDTIGRPFSPVDRLWHLVLPALVLSLVHIAELMRYTRAAVLDVIRLDFVRTARAKGLRGRVVLLRHVLPNALLSVITVVGLSIPQLLGGTLITETIFSWPGMGSLSIEAIRQRDYPIVMGVVLVSAVAVLIVNLLTDIAYAIADPRVRYD